MKKLLLSYSLFFIPYFLLSQNVGIGTTSPTSKLHVKGTGNGTQIILEENTGSILRISNEATAIGPYIGTTSNHPLTLVANNAGRMTILGNGNVGIGTSTPEQLFSVAGGMVVDQNNLNNGTPTTMLRFGSSSGEGIGSRRTAGTNQYGLDIYTQNINRMTITNGGNVGIGLLNPSSKLEIRGALGFSSTTKRWEMNYDSTAGYFYIDEFGSGRRLAIKNGGNVGVNTTNPQTTLDVNGDVNVENKLLLNNSTGNTGQVLTSGGPSSSPSWTNTSYGNQDRFLFKPNTSDFVTNANFSGILKFDVAYALSSAISYNSSNGVLTVNKSGLYEFTGSFTAALNIQSNNNGVASVLIVHSSFGVMVLGTVTIITRYSSPNYYGYSYIPISFQLYLTAGSTFYFIGQSGANDAVINSSGFDGSPVSINLISE